jgi:hypothetical protein
VQPTALVTTRIAATELFNESARSLHLVVGQSYYLNLNARLQMQAMQLAVGNVTYLDPAEAEKATRDYERSWEFWKSRLPRR